MGGVARSVDFFTRDLRALNHDVLVVAPHFEGESNDEDHVLRVPAIQNFSGSDFSVRIRLPAKLEKTIKAFEPEIIHSHHPMLMGDTALRFSRKYGLPLVFTHHTMYEQYTHHVHLDTDTVRRFVIKLVTLYTGFCDRVVAPSRSIASILRSRGVQAPIATLPTGVDLMFFSEGDGSAFRRSHNIPEDAEVVGYLGRLAPEKNLVFLARAVADFVRSRHNAYFLVVGDGRSREEIAAVFEAAHAGDRLRIAGEAHGDMLRAAYHAMDVFAFASKTETQGMVLVEAMAAGLPVIALDAPGSREVVRHGANGLLLPESISFQGFTEGLETYFFHPATQKRWKLEARDTAGEFAREECARAMADLYAAVLEERSIRPAVHHDKYVALETLMKKLKIEWDLLAEKALAATQAIHSRKEKAPPGSETSSRPGQSR
ncbi:MAG: glycosyltransferase [Desulfosarcinaceae bacterium]